MNEALLKTLELLLIIAIGYALQRKLRNKGSLQGIKTIILSIALPATIFLALLKINLDASLLFLPILALGFNLIMFGAAVYLLPLIFEAENDKIHRTRSLLLPSLAPGLSCFPFIMAYLGDDQLAIAALADVGNKVFGLILLFIVAMYWHRRYCTLQEESSHLQKLKDLFVSLFSEPINIIIVLAIVLLSAGVTLTDLPMLAQNIAKKLSLIMVPLILLFIGLSVRIGFGDFLKMIQLLTWRSGMAFCLSGIALAIFPQLAFPMAILLVVFPQSSCSFWPFAHMCSVGNIEEKEGQPDTTFDQNYAINILACSLPFSTCIIIGIFYLGEVLINPLLCIGIGTAMIAVAVIPRMVASRTTVSRETEVQRVV